MNWSLNTAEKLLFSAEISNLAQKQKIADHVAGFVRDGDVIGAGSGSTSFVTLKAIAERAKAETINVLIIPTSKEIELTAALMGLKTTSLLSAKPSWYFDGADEVDADRNLIKGRGGAMYKEKLVMKSAEKTYILVDQSKFVDRLGEKFSIPLEVQQEALGYVEEALKGLGAQDIALRPAKGKDGPIITESGHFILDVNFKTIESDLELHLKSITGVIESGLFWGYIPEIITDSL